MSNSYEYTSTKGHVREGYGTSHEWPEPPDPGEHGSWRLHSSVPILVEGTTDYIIWYWERPAY